MLRAALALSLSVPFALAAPVPAHAADAATLGCVEAGLDANARKLLLDDLTINLNNAGKDQSYRPETVQAIQAVARACQQKNNWSDAATSASILYTMPKIGWPTADR